MTDTTHGRSIWRRQKSIDALVFALTAIFVIAFVGMMADIPALIILAVPTIFALLLYMAVGDLPDRTRRSRIYWLIHVFNAVSLALWLVILFGLNDVSQWWGGLPISTAFLYFVCWPFYTLAGGLLYAYISKAGGVLREHQESVEAEHLGSE